MRRDSARLREIAALRFRAVLRALPLGDPIYGDEDCDDGDSEDYEWQLRFDAASVGAWGEFVERRCQCRPERSHLFGCVRQWRISVGKLESILDACLGSRECQFENCKSMIKPIVAAAMAIAMNIQIRWDWVSGVVCVVVVCGCCGATGFGAVAGVGGCNGSAWIPAKRLKGSGVDDDESASSTSRSLRCFM
jgi:hypothetical protein